MTELSKTHFTNRVIVHPNHANAFETAHGGDILKWMDEVGALAAMRFAGQPTVTAEIDQTNFKNPIEVGDTALIEGYVYEASDTSVSVRIQAFKEDPRSGEQEKATESFFTYVAIDEEGNPQSVPSLAISSDEEKRLREEALSQAERIK